MTKNSWTAYYGLRAICLGRIGVKNTRSFVPGVFEWHSMKLTRLEDDTSEERYV